MKRAILVSIAIVALAGIAIGAVMIFGGPSGPTYESLRQRGVQTIPGALGYELEPAPAGFSPALSPAEARARWPADGGEVSVALATIRDTFEGTPIGPAWVLFARGVCLRNAKGELVSDARGGDPNDLACTDDTIWVLAVDTTSGEPLVALTAYDETQTWGPTLG